MGGLLCNRTKHLLRSEFLSQSLTSQDLQFLGCQAIPKKKIDNKFKSKTRKMSEARISNKFYLLGLVVMFILSSCAVTLPRPSKTTIGEIGTNDIGQIESLKRGEYSVLKTTTGKASTTRCYILFIPIGKHKTNSELFDNAYYAAVENLPNADALILPRQKTKKLTIPLLLFNYNRRTTTVTGLGISVKDKILGNTLQN